MIRRPPRSTLFPYTTALPISDIAICSANPLSAQDDIAAFLYSNGVNVYAWRGETELEYKRCIHSVRSEEHTSELQSRQYLVCRLLLEKKKKNYHICVPHCHHN